MNCQEVETIIVDLARGAAVNENALAHVKECRPCRDRLADEERLTAGLQVLANTSIGEQAPAVVEEKLLLAFRRQAVPERHSRRWIPLVAVGSIAAAALVFRLFTPVDPAATVARPASEPAVASVTQAEVEAAPITNRKMKVRRARSVPQAIRAPEPAPVEAQFLPVVQGDAWTPLDGGRLVRVKLPRSSLRFFGLPMDEERAMEQVQADVMLSNDGLLRAIRFVQ